jgi:plasmid stabilization system protein ParE
VKPFEISAPASEELTKAIQWYEQRRGGLGVELFDAVSHTIDVIREHPEIGASRTDRLPSRQLRVLGFPYKVAYRIREHDIYVVAIAHTKRRPGYWKDRR